MKLMILAAALAMSVPAQADEALDEAHYAAQLTACELVIALDNVAEEAAELGDLAKRRKRHQDARALADLAEVAVTLADKVDRWILSPLERGATFAYTRAQVGRLKSDFARLAERAEEVQKRSRYLDAELELVAARRQDLKDILTQADQGRGSREDVVSR